MEQIFFLGLLVVVAFSLSFLGNALVDRFFAGSSRIKYIKLSVVPLFSAVIVFSMFYLPAPYSYLVGAVPVSGLLYIVFKYYFVGGEQQESEAAPLQVKKFERKKRLKVKK